MHFYIPEQVRKINNKVGKIFSYDAFRLLRNCLGYITQTHYEEKNVKVSNFSVTTRSRTNVVTST